MERMVNMQADPTADGRPLLSISEAAALAGLSRAVAYRLATIGALPGLVRLPGARLRVRRRVLERWLEGVDVDSTAAAISTLEEPDQTSDTVPRLNRPWRLRA